MPIPNGGRLPVFFKKIKREEKSGEKGWCSGGGVAPSSSCRNLCRRNSCRRSSRRREILIRNQRG